MNSTREANASLLSDMGCKLPRNLTKNVLVMCPFHENKRSPSFSVNLDKGAYFCHSGSCGAYGWLTSAHEEYWGALDAKAQAVQEYLTKLGEPEPEPQPLDKAILQSYRKYHPYLATRGIDKEVAARAWLGFDPEFGGRVTFPIVIDKTLWGFVKRATQEWQVPKYYNTTGLPKADLLYIPLGMRESGHLFVGEGPFDAIMPVQHGFAGCSILGSYPSLKQVELIEELAGERVIVLGFDDDEAGRTATTVFLDLCNRPCLVANPRVAGSKDLGGILTPTNFYAMFNSAVDRYTWARERHIERRAVREEENEEEEVEDE